MKITFVTGISINPMVNRFVADPHLLIVGIVHSHSSCNRFRGPFEVELGDHIVKELLISLSSMMSCSMTALFCVILGRVVPVDGVIGVSRSVSLDLTADTRMMSSDTTADFS